MRRSSPLLGLNVGVSDASTSNIVQKRHAVRSQGLRVACSLLSGAGALMAATPSEAAIAYSGKKNITVHLPGRDFVLGPGDQIGPDAFAQLIEPITGAQIGFGWIGNTDQNIAILAVSQPLSLAVGDPISQGTSKAQLAAYSAGESVGATGNYKTPDPTDTDPSAASSFFAHITNPPIGDLITDWQLNSTAFVGVRADSAQGSKYGWIRFTTPPSFDAGAPLTLVDWAWETELDTPILAGDGIVSTPAPLPALGAAAALAASRRLRRRIKQAQADGSAVSAIDQKRV